MWGEGPTVHRLKISRLAFPAMKKYNTFRLKIEILILILVNYRTNHQVYKISKKRVFQQFSSMNRRKINPVVVFLQKEKCISVIWLIELHHKDNDGCRKKSLNIYPPDHIYGPEIRRNFGSVHTFSRFWGHLQDEFQMHHGKIGNQA